jgi:hypothetical protein
MVALFAIGVSPAVIVSVKALQYQITVVDSYSKLPLGGACITLMGSTVWGDTIFYQRFTNGYGVAIVDPPFTPNSWHVELDGYTEQIFVWPPSLGVIVYLESIVPQITLNIATSGPGYVANGPTNQYHQIHGPIIYHVGNTVTFVAIPEQGSTFINWVLNGVAYTDNTLNLAITQPMEGQTLTAVFSETTLPLVPSTSMAIVCVAAIVVSIAVLFRKKPMT